MYTNELLEIKREAQRALLEKARASGKSYFDVVDEEARRCFEEYGVTPQYADLKPAPFVPPRETAEDQATPAAPQQSRDAVVGPKSVRTSKAPCPDLNP